MVYLRIMSYYQLTGQMMVILDGISLKLEMVEYIFNYILQNLISLTYLIEILVHLK